MSAPLPPPVGEVVAFLDIGTNSVRMSVVRVNPSGAFSVVAEEKEVVRLGEGELSDRRLGREAMDRAVLVCRTFAGVARAHGAHEIHAVATSAAREATNQAELLARFRREAGIDVRVVPGREEARLIYLGVASGLHLEGRTALLVDIGGGSTELIVGDAREHLYLASLSLGAIRLTGHFPDARRTGPVARGRFEEMCRHVRSAAVRAVEDIRALRVDVTIGSSGTINNLVEVAARRRGDTRRAIRLPELREIALHLAGLPLAERRTVPGLAPHRADIIVAGAAILLTLLEDLRVPEIQASGRGLRDGLLVDYLARHHPETWPSGMSVRDRSVLGLARACAFDEPHARHIAKLACELFDSAQALGLHTLGPPERELLAHAALLHDIGKFLSFSNHHAHAYYLIRHADLLGFDQQEADVIATVAFYHRTKKVPRKKHKEFALLDERAAEVVRLLSVLLRIAEGLDRGHARRVRSARFTDADASGVTLSIDAMAECPLEQWALETHERSLEEALGRPLRIATTVRA